MFWIFSLLLIAPGCTSADIEAQRLADTVESATQQGVRCRTSISSKPGYRILAAHFPLVDIEEATLPQMKDESLANREEDVALAAWQQDIRLCGNQLVDFARQTTPAYVPIIIATWNKDDEVFVQLARRKMAWGDAVMRLKANRTELLTKVADQLSRMTRELNERQQKALDRRASYLDSLLGLVP